MLTLLIVIPLITALIVLLNTESLARPIALVGSTITGILSLIVLFEFDATDAGYQFVTDVQWIPALGINWTLGVDGISLWLVVLAGLLFPIAILTTSAHHDKRQFYFHLLGLQAGSLGAFLAIDLFLFFAFFEIVLVPMYFLIGGWGHGDRVYAALKFFLYTMAASALMLVGILALGILTRDGTLFSFDIRDIETALDSGAVGSTARWLILISFVLAFAVKVPVFPIHTWLPNAHTEAPTAGSVILAGVMLKLGTYGLIRFGLGLFPEETIALAPLFLTLGVIGIIYGAAVATVQTDLKKLVAYSSVAHMGFIVLGIFAFNSQGLNGAVVQMINHGISTGALFILVGWMYDRLKTREISQMSGLQKSAPVFAGVMTLVVLSSIGLPGLNGFVGEFLILLGTFSAARWWAVVATAGVILAALYLLWAYQRTFHGSPAGTEGAASDKVLKDLSVKEILGIAPLLAVIVFFGVYPTFMLDRIEPSVDLLIADIESDVATFDESEPNQEVPERSGPEGLTESLEIAEEKKAEAAALQGES